MCEGEIRERLGTNGLKLCQGKLSFPKVKISILFYCRVCSLEIFGWNLVSNFR